MVVLCADPFKFWYLHAAGCNYGQTESHQVFAANRLYALSERSMQLTLTRDGYKKAVDEENSANTQRGD